MLGVSAFLGSSYSSQVLFHLFEVSIDTTFYFARGPSNSNFQLSHLLLALVCVCARTCVCACGCARVCACACGVCVYLEFRGSMRMYSHHTV